MDSTQLRVQMLGNFRLDWEGAHVDDGDNRSRKAWLLLAYIIYCRGRVVTQDEIMRLLWENDTSANPVNAMKTMMHRVRTMLNQLGPTAGHVLIQRRKGGYAWTEEIPTLCDTDEFEACCRAAAASEDEQEQRKNLTRAVELYQGDFLARISTESWVLPISAYYHQTFIEAACRLAELLYTAGEYQQAVDACRRGLAVESYNEDLNRCLMRSLLALGEREEVIAVYDELNERLYSEFGVRPSDDLRQIYREAGSTRNGQLVPLGEVMDQLRESDIEQGALMCEYDFFKVVYQAEARRVSRSGDVVHIALFSVNGKAGTELSKRSLDNTMRSLGEEIHINLRLGDVAASCSVSQYILMLPQANYENAVMVCERVIRAFYRQHPHSPADVTFHVEPLEPTT